MGMKLWVQTSSQPLIQPGSMLRQTFALMKTAGSCTKEFMGWWGHGDAVANNMYEETEPLWPRGKLGPSASLRGTAPCPRLRMAWDGYLVYETHQSPRSSSEQLECQCREMYSSGFYLKVLNTPIDLGCFIPGHCSFLPSSLTNSTGTWHLPLCLSCASVWPLLPPYLYWPHRAPGLQLWPEICYSGLHLGFSSYVKATRSSALKERNHWFFGFTQFGISDVSKILYVFGIQTEPLWYAAKMARQLDGGQLSFRTQLYSEGRGQEFILSQMSLTMAGSGFRLPLVPMWKLWHESL